MDQHAAPTTRAPAASPRQLTAVAALLGVAAVWGSTYVVVKSAVSTMPVGDFLTWRFALATVVVFAVRPRAVLRLGAAGVGVGAATGLMLALGYALQTAGLLTTPASVSGFITGTLVVITPLAASVLLRDRVTRSGWAAVGLATVGLALLCLRELSLGAGEAMTLGCAVFFALHIVALSRWASRHDLLGLVVVQMLTVTLASAAVAAPRGLSLPPHGSAWSAVVLTGLAATAIAYFVQTWAQMHLSATRTGIILTTEPVFAGLVGVLVAGESFGARAALGAAILVAAMLLSAVQGGTHGGSRHGRHTALPDRRPQDLQK